MSYPSFEKILELQYKLNDFRGQYWLAHDLFTWQWWFLLLMFIVPWLIWYKIIPKERKAETLSFGLILGIIGSQLDEIGISNGAWAYPYQLSQFNRGLNPYNFTFIPVAYMIVYHYFPKWKHFIIGNIILAIIAAYMTEPILKAMGIYKTFFWKSIYSVLCYIALPILIRWVIYYLLEKNKGKST